MYFFLLDAGYSVAPLQVHCYSEALPTQHGCRVGVSRRSAMGNCELRTCQGSYVIIMSHYEKFCYKTLDVGSGEVKLRNDVLQDVMRYDIRLKLFICKLLQDLKRDYVFNILDTRLYVR